MRRNLRELERASGELHGRLHCGRTDDIFKFGLHEYLIPFLQSISSLGEASDRVRGAADRGAHGDPVESKKTASP